MAFTVPSTSSNRARIFGIVAIVIGVVGAIMLWLFAGKRYDDAVSDLAPAPVGCDTTLVFDSTGTFTFYVETQGEVGEIEGDCGRDERDYEFDGEETPRVELSLVDGEGDEVDLDRADGPSYDRSGSRGSGVRTADIEDTGEYVLSVSSEEEDVMIRVGRDPSSGVTAMRVGSGVLLLAGLVLGGVALARSRRAPVSQPAPIATAWPAGHPVRPTAPPYANPSVPPPYATPRPLPPPRQTGPPRGSPLPPPPPPRR